MNSMMLNSRPMLRPGPRLLGPHGVTPRAVTSWDLSPVSFDAGAAARAHHRGVHRGPGQHHPVAWLQLQLATLVYKIERDRAVHAVEDLLVVVGMGGVAVAGSVRPRVAATRLGPELCHQLVEGVHDGPDSKMASMRPRFLADCNVGRLARWLRALGYDASYHARIDDSELVREAAAEDRVLLTRDRDLTRRRVIQTGVVRAILIRDDDVISQLRQVF